MNEIKIFENADFGEIRVAGNAECPMFCLADLCRVLELQTGATKNRLDEGGISLINTPTKNQFGTIVEQQMIFINEKNLYKLIMRSDKPQAEPFQDWVCGEVLPEIRRTGSYGAPKSYKEALLELIRKEEEKEKLLLENHELHKDADYTRNVLAVDRLFPTKAIAMDYGMTASEFNRLLEAMRIQYKQGRRWYLYKPYLNKGYAAMETMLVNDDSDVVMNLKWTQAGRKFLHDFLAEKGIITVQERNPSLF